MLENAQNIIIQRQRGFTIVELLIVIVIIAILAAITIVAFNGIQNRAKTSAGQSLANSIVKKAHAYSTINGVYPTRCQLVYNQTDAANNSPAVGNTGTTGCTAGTAANAAGSESKLDNTAQVAHSAQANGSDYTSTISNSNAVVGYLQCPTGVNVYYWDYTVTSSNQKILKAGTGC